VSGAVFILRLAKRHVYARGLKGFDGSEVIRHRSLRSAVSIPEA
jgi:hypothetical protein